MLSLFPFLAIPVPNDPLANLTERIGATSREVHIQDLGYAHELVHLRERYHTLAFWERLERVLPDYEARRDWLAQEGGKYDL